MSRQSSDRFPRGHKAGDVENPVREFRTKAKINAVQLIRSCLRDHSALTDTDQEEVVASVAAALEIDNTGDKDDENEDDGGHSKRVVNSYLKPGETGSTSGDIKKKRATLAVDEHNDLCEVCETGGDLLCCDTCSLVFHVKCIRPKLSAVPKGNWSCARCIVDELADGDVDEAKKAIRNMNRLGCGAEGSKSSRYSKELENIIVAQSGKKFAVRQEEDTQNIELGRFATVKEAFSFINDLSKPKRVSMRPVKPKTSRRRAAAASGDTSEDDEAAEGDAAVDEDDELWCTHCLDDDAVIMCAFCGCKSCFGKFDSDLLILCDHCDQEIHTYCFEPPLSEVPSEDPWYCCEVCSVTARAMALPEDDSVGMEETHVLPHRRPLEMSGIAMEGHGSPRLSVMMPGGGHESGTHSRRDSVVSLASFGSQSSPHGGVPGMTGPPVHRGRGRPPSAHKRSLSNLSTSDETALAAAQQSFIAYSEAQAASSGPQETPKTTTSTASLASVATNVNKAAGVDNVLSIVGKSSRRVFSSTESDTLEQLRQWAPLTDLERVVQALLRQKMSLLERIRSVDPNIFLDANDQLYSLPVMGLPGASPLMPGVPPGPYMSPQQSYLLPSGGLLPPTGGMGLVGGLSYAVPYPYLKPGELVSGQVGAGPPGSMLMPGFEVPVTKPKRKQSKKSPGEAPAEKRFRQDSSGGYSGPSEGGALDYSAMSGMGASGGLPHYSPAAYGYPMNPVSYGGASLYPMSGMPGGMMPLEGGGGGSGGAAPPVGSLLATLPPLYPQSGTQGGMVYPHSNTSVSGSGVTENSSNVLFSSGSASSSGTFGVDPQ